MTLRSTRPQRMSSLMSDLESPQEGIPVPPPISVTPVNQYLGPASLDVIVNHDLGWTNVMGHVNGDRPISIEYRLVAPTFYQLAQFFTNKVRLNEIYRTFTCEIDGPGIQESIPTLPSSCITLIGKKDFKIYVDPKGPATFYINFWNSYSVDIHAKLNFSEGFWVRSG